MEGGWWVQERLGVPRMSLPVGSRGDSCTVLQQQSALNVGPGSLSVIGGNAWEVSVLGSADLLCLHLGGPSGGADTAQVWEPSILNAPSGGLSLF